MFIYFLRKAKSAADGIMQLGRAICESDINVCVIADGSYRYDTKRDSASRSINREKNRQKALKLQSRLSASIQGNGGEIQISELSSNLQKARNQASTCINDSFAEELLMKVQLYNNSIQKLITCKLSESQADPLIARRSLKGLPR